MKKPTADVLKQARESLAEAMEQRSAAREAATTAANRLTAPDFSEEVDGAALKTAQRNFKNLETLVHAKTDAVASLLGELELEQRMGGESGGAAPGVSIAVISKRTKDGDLPTQFSLIRALRAKHGIKNARGVIDKMDGIEAEMIQEGEHEARNAEITEFDPNGFMVPQMCAYRSHNPNSEMERRDLSVGTTTAGGHLVETQLGGLIGFLDPNTPLIALGARVLTGLQGNLTFPRQTARATGYAVAEAAAITESQQTLNTLALTPKRQGAYTEFSRQLLLQSSVDVENWLREDLRTVLMNLQEQYAIQGTGSSSQPTGITATSGIGSVAGGTNGLIPAWSHMTALEYEVAVDNALRGSLGYLLTPGVANVLKNVKRDVAGNGFILEGANGMGTINGYKSATSTLVPSTLTKGSASGICHAIIFGNFRELVLAYWGGVEIVMNPYSLDTTGSYRITANTFMDVGVRTPQSFAAMLDALIS